MKFNDYWMTPTPNRSEEETLREENAAVKDAWEKYQVILKLNMKNVPSKEAAMEIKRQHTIALLKQVAGI